jgi:hypothetical protein
MGNAISAIGSVGSQFGNAAANAAAPQNFGQPIYSAGTTQLNPNFANNADQVQTSVPMQN